MQTPSLFNEAEGRRDDALDLLRVYRAGLIRRTARAFVFHLFETGRATTDRLRELVPAPPGIDPRYVGSAVRLLAEHSVIVSIGREKSRRPEAHARYLDLWTIADPEAAQRWLIDHPEPADADALPEQHTLFHPNK